MTEEHTTAVTPTEEPGAPEEHTPQPHASRRQTAVSSMRLAFWLVLLFTAASLFLNLYSTIAQFTAMEYPMSVIWMSVLPSIFSNLCIFVPIAFLFLFFAELLEVLYDQKEQREQAD